MRIALVLNNIYLMQSESSLRKIMLFEVREDLVTAVDEDIILMSDINYLCLWLLGRNVKKVYCDGLTKAGEEFLTKAGIRIYPLESIRDHPILQALLLKEDKK
jgi:hypothetical protein